MKPIRILISSIFFIISVIFTQEIVMGLGSYDGSSAEITMDTPYDVGGFQFNAVGANVASGSGGLASDAGFTVAKGGEIILG